MLAKFGKNRKGEGGGFSGARLGAADDIASGHYEGHRPQLNGSRHDIAHRFDALKNFLGKAEVQKNSCNASLSCQTVCGSEAF